VAVWITALASDGLRCVAAWAVSSGGISVGPRGRRSRAERRGVFGSAAGVAGSPCSGSTTWGPDGRSRGWGVMRTLGGWARSNSEVSCTLGGAARSGVGTVVGWVGAGTAEAVKMSDSCCIAFIWASPRGVSGEDGAGLRRAQHSSMAARMAASADDKCGILP
jgi:hypothetical protein